MTLHFQSEAVEASASPRPLDTCRKSRDCPVKNPKSKKKPTCFRHHDKRNINSGICLESRDECEVHDECLGKGGKCCNGYCCNGEYFEAIKEFPCNSDDGCKVKIRIFINGWSALVQKCFLPTHCMKEILRERLRDRGLLT